MYIELTSTGHPGLWYVSIVQVGFQLFVDAKKVTAKLQQPMMKAPQGQTNPILFPCRLINCAVSSLEASDAQKLSIQKVREPLRS